MLRKANDLRNFRLGARDGEIGRAKDFYFDDESWTVRYLVADTGTWLPLRKVLISPFALGNVNDSEKILGVNLDKRQIEQCPPMDDEKPVSRQYEEEFHRYYGWPMYWHGPWLWGPTAYPGYAGTAELIAESPPEERKERPPGDPHLRSTTEVAGYHIQALDDEIGHVDDFIIDDHDWVIRYLVVDTRNWWPGRTVLLSPQWITSVSWHESKVHVDLNATAIKNAPEFDNAGSITREYEERLFQYYEREGYWMRRAA
jgi:hypothetical protein